MITLIFGVRGSGKSWLLHGLLAGKNPPHTCPARLLLIDPMREHGKPPGRPEYTDKVPPWTDSPPIGATTTSAKDAARYLRARGACGIWRLVVQCTPSEEELDALLKIAWALGGCTVAVEELDLWTTASKAPAGLVECVERGAHHAVQVYATTRRPQRIPKTITAQASVIYSSRMHEPADLEYFKAAGISGLEELGPGQWVKWEDGKQTVINFS